MKKKHKITITISSILIMLLSIILVIVLLPNHEDKPIVDEQKIITKEEVFNNPTSFDFENKIASKISTLKPYRTYFDEELEVDFYPITEILDGPIYGNPYELSGDVALNKDDNGKYSLSDMNYTSFEKLETNKANKSEYYKELLNNYKNALTNFLKVEPTYMYLMPNLSLSAEGNQMIVISSIDDLTDEQIEFISTGGSLCIAYTIDDKSYVSSKLQIVDDIDIFLNLTIRYK